MGVQQGSRIIEVTTRRVGGRHYHDLQTHADLWLLCSAVRLTARGRCWQKLRPDRTGLRNRPHAACAGPIRQGMVGPARTIIMLHRYLMP
jgi:hypothetical protein